MSNKKHYTKKGIKSGNVFEYYEYGHPITYGCPGKKQGGRKSGTSGNRMRSEEYRKRTTNKAKYELIRLINSNFTYSMKEICDFPKFITLTFRDGSIPDITNVKQANSEFKKFIRKLRQIYIKNVRSLKYICVIEFQDKNNRGAVHYHLVTNIPVLPVSQEKAKDWISSGKLPVNYNPKKNLHDLWGNGSVTVKAIRNSIRNRRTSSMIETKNIGHFLASYMVKDIEDPRLIGFKSYLISKGLKKPEVLYGERAERISNYYGDKNVEYTTSYSDKYHQSEIQYTKYNYYLNK